MYAARKTYIDHPWCFCSRRKDHHDDAALLSCGSRGGKEWGGVQFSATADLGRPLAWSVQRFGVPKILGARIRRAARSPSSTALGIPYMVYLLCSCVD